MQDEQGVNPDNSVNRIEKMVLKKYNKLKAKGLIQNSISESKIIAELADYMLEQSTIPQKYLQQNLTDLTLTSAQEGICNQIIQAYKDNLKTNLETGQGAYLWASGQGENKWGTGTGKTSLAVIIIKSLIDDLAAYVYNSLTEVQKKALKHLRDWTTSVRRHDILGSRHVPYLITGANYFRNLEEADDFDKQRLKARARKALILIWDDYGTEKINWYHDAIFSLLNERIKYNRPIIFTSNWEFDLFANLDYKNNSQAMRERGGRLASRIAGMVEGLVFRMEGKDWRMEELKNINW